jgi:dTDP-4-dehydrorhamnose 3,5-epimerase
VKFVELPLAGAFLVRLDLHTDERGFFARSFCVDEFAAAGLPVDFTQQSIAPSRRAGTLRGLHFQAAPHAEDKFVRCVRGAIFDAIVDLRPASATYLQTTSVRLDEEGGDALFVPAGCAHGYQTLQDDTDVLYAMSARYAPQAAGAIRWDDPELNIAWPIAAAILSENDRNAPGLQAFLRERNER